LAVVTVSGQWTGADSQEGVVEPPARIWVASRAVMQKSSSPLAVRETVQLAPPSVVWEILLVGVV
jgi:hypothetical protein